MSPTHLAKGKGEKVYTYLFMIPRNTETVDVARKGRSAQVANR